MPRRREVLGLIERPDVDVNLGRPSLTLVAQGRTTLAAIAPLHPRRRSEKPRLRALEAHVVALETSIGRDRRARVFAAGIAMAIAGPLRCAVNFERHGTAKASARVDDVRCHAE